jgi:hypothetical protein
LNAHGILTHGIPDEPIVLNDDDEESESEESESTRPEAGEGYHEVGPIGELDATTPPHDPTSGLIGDGLDPATQPLLSDRTAINDSNDGVADDECPLPNVGSIGELDAAPPRDPTSQPIDDGFDLATQLLLFHHTDGVANSSNADGNDGNNGVIDDECPLLTKRQRSTSSCGGPTLDCDGPDELEDDGAFDVIATGDDEDARPPKRRRLPAVSCRYPSPASTISKIQEGEIDQTQSPIAAAAAIQQSDLRSSHNCHREGIAESEGDNSGSPINGEPADTDSSVTVALQTDVGDPQHSDLWEIRGIIGTRKVDGVVHYWVDWEPTWMLESELGGAREFVDEFKARLQERRGNKNGQRETGTAGEAQPKRRRGRPRKQS